MDNGSWSFRGVDARTQDRYFEKINDRWVLREEFRGLVKFSTLNLLMDLFPDFGTGMFKLDPFLCRNVYIYFSRPAVTNVLGKMRDSLGRCGYLMTGLR